MTKTRGMMVVAWLCLAASLGSARAAVDPVFMASSPAFDSRRPDVTVDGEGQDVDELTGAAGFAYPFTLPPGRKDLTPKLALRYSSQGGHRGGVAAGWSLPLPAIRRDFSVGTLAAAEYSASVGGASGRLVAVNDASTLGGATYRLREDDAFVRFEFLGAPSFAGLSWTPPTGGWLALAADGTRYYLGGLTQASDGSSRWHLTHEVDPQGNTTRYAWSRVVDGAGRLLDFSLDSIEYTGNPLIGADSHARVDFSYQFDPFGLSACPSSAIPVGARSDNHGGLLYAEGARKLVAVTTFVRDTPTARWRQVRRVQLNYEASTESCSAAFSPFRQLRSLDVSATSPTGVVTLLRPVSFGYGPPQRLLNRTVNDHRGPGLISWGDDQGQTDTLLDYDGDGLLDHLQVEQDGSKCVLHVYRGARGGGTAGKYLIDLPMMPWANGTSPAFNEKCSLGGQKTFRANLNPQHSCGHAGNLNAYHFDDVDGDGKVDLLTSLQVDPDSYNPSVDPQVDNGSSVTAANPCAPLTAPTTRTFTAWAGKVGPSVCQFYPTQKNQDCNGQYAWRLYRNVGTALTAFPRLASFGSAMTRVPVPMDPDNSLNGHLGVGSLSTHYGFHAVADLDGDGKLDAILGNQTTSNLFWKVHRGNGNGTFASTAVTWPVPAGVTTQPSSTGQNNFGIPKLSYTFSSLMDVNGDGLADLLTQSGSELSAFLNTGTGFSPTPTRLGVNLTVDMSASYTDAIGGGQILHSHREFVHRLFDVDHDGLPDFLDFSSGAPVYRPNSGDRFLEPRPLHSAWLSARRRIDNSYPGWETTTDAYDRDGDGLPDLVSNSTTAESMTRVHDEFSGAPPRLLNTIDSGRGRVVRFSYALSTDTTAVTQQPGAGTYLPSVNWVVTKVTVSDVGGVPDAVTQYTYADPIYGRESLLLKDAASFLGFKTVTVDRSGPTGGTSLGRRLVKSFAYDLANDARARLVRELTYNRSATGALVLQRDRSMVWTSLPLFNGASFHRAIQSERSTVCAATGACTPTVWNTLRTENTQTPHVHGGMNVLYLASASRRGPGSAPSDQDRRERSTFQVRYGQAPFSASDYRVLEAERLREAATPGSGGNSFTTIGRVVKSYDPASGLLLRIDTALDAARVATTAFTYTSSGQTRTHTRPESFAAGGARKTEYTYDVRELYATQVVNPLGHVVFPSHDVGTGVSLGTKGPQSKQVGTATVWATSSVTIDGLGRVLTESVPVDDAAAGYVSRQTRTVAFNDSSVPATVTTSTLQDFGGAAQVKELQRYDGTGRELSRTRFRQLPGQPDEVWTTTYNALGELATVVGPDPRVDTGATITHKALGYDALGRVILSKAADGSGVATTYDGLVRSDAELTASAGAHKSTFDTKNPFGETIRVDEVDHQAQSAATTVYAHAPQGGVSSVTDADGVVTTYERNFMGEILAVRRGGRTWEHGYDLEGNLAFSRLPRPAGAPAADYTVTFTYDALGRLARRAPGSRGLSAARRAELGIGEATFRYDANTNGVGLLSSAQTPSTWTSYFYDPRGLTTGIQRGFSVNTPGLATAKAIQSVAYTHNAQQQLVRVDHDDGTRWQNRHDARGLVERVEWLDPVAGGPRAVAAMTRSLHGQVRVRDTDYGQRRTYGFDVIGRVTADAIEAGSPLTVRASRGYVYDPRGDIASVTGSSAGASAAAAFSYDALHRIRTASGPLGYAGSFAYSKAGNVTAAKVSWSGGAINRSVSYQYGAVDPHAVDALLPSAGGAAFARFSYEASGSMSTRITAAGTTTFVTDAEERKREASGPQGREVYHYDEHGQRSLVVSSSGVRFYFAGSETHFTAAGTQKLRYVHIGEGTPLARVQDGKAVELTYADSLQNLILAMDGGGAVTASFLYGAFGERLNESGAATHRRQFNDKENDALTGLSYYGARYYDPLTLRWTSADPFARVLPESTQQHPQLLNLYAFSLNNPMTYVDPDGRAPKTDTSESTDTKGCGSGVEDEEKCKGGDDEKKTNTEAKKVTPAQQKKQLEALTVKLYESKRQSGVIVDAAALAHTAKELSRMYGIKVTVEVVQSILGDVQQEQWHRDVAGRRSEASQLHMKPGGVGPAGAYPATRTSKEWHQSKVASDMRSIREVGPVGLVAGAIGGMLGGTDGMMKGIEAAKAVDGMLSERYGSTPTSK